MIDYTSPIGQVRVLIPDLRKLEDLRDLRNEPRYLFTDDEILAFLAVNNGNVKRAAADACDAIGMDKALQLLVLKTDDKQTDGAKLLDAIVKRAKTLREQAKEDDENNLSFDVIMPSYEPVDWVVNF
ncbi:MAG: hypothetical protein HXN12_00585 [Porphyromonadaceae bacterium]|jgi:hypothetical protein|nr:hypothetical protein [Porphyromonadaceae bacterium]DAT15643.1 MAG TPA: hypothetical protein [Caudoviricetes sp.]DAV84418.1 MAG TPA: hypothetical protein [Caudoviricetes sp.]DAW15545.1 MAG TPA: hypothetical protein [Caudoviricetes sp.]